MQGSPYCNASEGKKLCGSGGAGVQADLNNALSIGVDRCSNLCL